MLTLNSKGKPPHRKCLAALFSHFQLAQHVPYSKTNEQTCVHDTLSPPRQKHPQHLVSLLLKDPTSIQLIRQLHTSVITTGLLSHPLFANTLNNSDAYVLLFNNLIRSYSICAFPLEAFRLYKYINQYVGAPSFDSFTYCFLCHACANSNAVSHGIQLHGLTYKMGFQFHVYVQTSLVRLYSVCGILHDAKQVFYEMSYRSSVTWNALMSGLVKWGELELACSFFDQMPSPNVISWTVIIDGYTRKDLPLEALKVFQKMVVLRGIIPNEVTLLAIFPAISSLGYIRSCQLVHSHVKRRGFHVSDIRIANSLIDCYAKCGCIASARRLFHEMSSQIRNLVSWTSLVSCFAMHGMGKEAVEYFENMEKVGLKPNQVTFLSVLSACSHGGLVDEGLKFFNKMVSECQIVPDVKHYGCLVDMLGRAGRLEAAEKVALDIPVETINAVIWRTLLGACSFHGNVEVGERVVRKTLEMEKTHGGDYVLMSNIFAGAGRHRDSELARQLLDKAVSYKVPGLTVV